MDTTLILGFRPFVPLREKTSERTGFVSEKSVGTCGVELKDSTHTVRAFPLSGTNGNGRERTGTDGRENGWCSLWQRNGIERVLRIVCEDGEKGA